MNPNSNARAARLPAIFRERLRTDETFRRTNQALAARRLHTVCRSARCPNRHECWNQGTATVMILGDICTRDCKYCAVASGRLAPPDPGEPERVAALVDDLSLRYLVVTSVTRDDLDDGGAGQFASTVEAVRRQAPEVPVEVLVPDFGGKQSAVETALKSAPAVWAHNLETVRRLQPLVRPRASYVRSLAVLRQAREMDPDRPIKSGLMLGLGETHAEVIEALDDLRAAGCDLLTLGQYLAPTRQHWPIARFWTEEEFAMLADEARRRDFRAVAAGPRVRSSYKAGQLYRLWQAG